MIIVFGPPGSGKSVQGKLLANANKWRWLSAGELLRNTDDINLHKIMDAGELVPADAINKVMSDAFKKAADVDLIVLDGFPRQTEQAKWLFENSPFHGHQVSAIILLDVSKKEIIKRLMLREREDDSLKAIKERLKIYHKKIRPVISYFKSRGVKILHVDGVGEIEEIHERIMRKLKRCNLAKN